MEMEIISEEKIKPSSPTPHHLRNYKISLLDQIIFPVFYPVILYFAPDHSNISEKIQLLKNSLSLTLSSFYPFAGVVRDSLSLDCNDEGLPFFVAKVKGQMRDFLERPDLQLINRLLPRDFIPAEVAGAGANIAKIQFNYFNCGGIALSVVFAHNVADLTSICTFLQAWAAIARDSNEVIRLDSVAQSAFPQKLDMETESAMFYPFMKFVGVAKFSTRRYVFDASAISALRAQMQPKSSNPTRVEVVSALIWKCFMAIVAEKSGNNRQKRPFLVTHTVNLRRRAEPPLPENSFGNFLWLTPALCTNPMEKELKDLVDEVKRAIRRIDKEFIKRLQSDDGYYENVDDLRKAIPGEFDWFSFTSWVNIRLYEVDFGWGRPVWVSGIVSDDSEPILMSNMATLVDTRAGDGIEAWVILEEKYVAEFENVEDMKMYARFNPSVL